MLRRRKKLKLELDTIKLGGAIQDLMDQKGLDAHTLADQVGISVRKLNKLIQGKGSLSFAVAASIAKALSADVSAMVFIKGEW